MSERKYCPLGPDLRKCNGSGCAWWRDWGKDCTLPLIADILADSDLCRTDFNGGGNAKMAKEDKIAMEKIQGIIKEYAEEFGWIDNNEFCVWVHWADVSDFLSEIRKSFGAGIFDDGGIPAIAQDGCICFTLSDTYLDIDEIYSKEEYRH